MRDTQYITYFIMYLLFAKCRANNVVMVLKDLHFLLLLRWSAVVEYLVVSVTLHFRVAFISQSLLLLHERLLSRLGLRSAALVVPGHWLPLLLPDARSARSRCWCRIHGAWTEPRFLAT